MSNRLFQGVIYQIKDAIDRTIGVVNNDGTVVCSSNLNLIGMADYVDFSKIYNLDPVVINGWTFLAVGNAPHPEYAVFVDGDDKKGSFLAGQISGLVTKEQKAAEIIEEIFAETEKVLSGGMKWVK